MEIIWEQRSNFYWSTGLPKELKIQIQERAFWINIAIKMWLLIQNYRYCTFKLLRCENLPGPSTRKLWIAHCWIIEMFHIANQSNAIKESSYSLLATFCNNRIIQNGRLGTVASIERSALYTTVSMLIYIYIYMIIW